MLYFDNRLAPGWEFELDHDERSTDGFWEEAFEMLESRSGNVGDKHSFKDFLLSMIALDPQNRQPAGALLNHSYLKDVPCCAGPSRESSRVN